MEAIRDETRRNREQTREKRNNMRQEGSSERIEPNAQILRAVSRSGSFECYWVELS